MAATGRHRPTGAGSAAVLVLTALAAAALVFPAPARSWSESFSGPAGSPPDPARWRHDTGATGWGNGELQRYTSSTRNARLDGRGHLEIVARRVAAAPRRGAFTSARLTTSGRFAFRYGTVEMRARLPRGRGLWPAFWMLGSLLHSAGWPAWGVIGVLANLGHDSYRAYGTVHGPGSLADEGFGGSVRSARSLSSDFHRFAARWTGESVTFLLDGRPYFTASRSAYPSGQQWALDQPMFLLLNLAVGGEWPGLPGPRTRFPARLVVDWVRVDEAGA